MRIFSIPTKCNYRYVHRFANNERMGLVALCSSSPPLVVMEDAFCVIFRHSVESKLALITTTTFFV